MGEGVRKKEQKGEGNFWVVRTSIFPLIFTWLDQILELACTPPTPSLTGSPTHFNPNWQEHSQQEWGLPTIYFHVENNCTKIVDLSWCTNSLSKKEKQQQWHNLPSTFVDGPKCRQTFILQETKRKQKISKSFKPSQSFYVPWAAMKAKGSSYRLRWGQGQIQHSQYGAILTRTSLVKKRFIIWSRQNLLLQEKVSYRERARQTYIAHWPSQPEQRIGLFLPAHGASHKQNFIYTLIFILLRFFKVLLFYDPQHPNTLNDRTLLIFTGL